MRTETVRTTTHGRVLVRDAREPVGSVVAFHGYAESADDAARDVERIPGIEGWRLVVPQGLHRFYTRRDDRVVASWMTRQDRELAIADNVAYVARVVEEFGGDAGAPLVYAGFSQGASMAYRAAMLGGRSASGIIALAGDVPPELRDGSIRGAWPPVLIGVGSGETWFTDDKVEGDLAFLRGAGADVALVRFDGGHEWTDEFRQAAGRWLSARR